MYCKQALFRIKLIAYSVKDHKSLFLTLLKNAKTQNLSDRVKIELLRI